jgi:hypothetical protein
LHARDCEISAGARHFGRFQINDPIAHAPFGAAEVLLRELVLFCRAIVVYRVGPVHENAIAHAECLVSELSRSGCGNISTQKADGAEGKDSQNQNILAVNRSRRNATLEHSCEWLAGARGGNGPWSYIKPENIGMSEYMHLHVQSNLTNLQRRYAILSSRRFSCPRKT